MGISQQLGHFLQHNVINPQRTCSVVGIDAQLQPGNRRVVRDRVDGTEVGPGSFVRDEERCSADQLAVLVR